MAIKDFVDKLRGRKDESKEKFKQMQEDFRLQKMLEERQKSANERELERYFKERREEDIKKQLDVIRKKQTKDAWKGKNMFSGKATILKQDKNILSNDSSMLGMGTMLKGSSQLLKNERMFLR